MRFFLKRVLSNRDFCKSSRPSKTTFSVTKTMEFRDARWNNRYENRQSLQRAEEIALPGYRLPSGLYSDKPFNAAARRACPRLVFASYIPREGEVSTLHLLIFTHTHTRIHKTNESFLRTSVNTSVAKSFFIEKQNTEP